MENLEIKRSQVKQPLVIIVVCSAMFYEDVNPRMFCIFTEHKSDSFFVNPVANNCFVKG